MMHKRNRGSSSAMVVAVGAAALSAALVSQRAFAQAAPESTDYQDPRSGGFVDSLATGAQFGTMLRFSNFTRSKPNHSGPSAEATGLGGWLFGESGEWRNLLSFGGALAYVAKVHGPEGHGGNFLLKDPDQEGYATLGVAYARLRYEDNALTAGRISPQYAWNLDNIYRFYNRLDGAFIGRRDVRAMVPLSYQGAQVAGKVANDTVRYYGGWVNKMKQVNDSDFKELAEAAFLPGESDGMGYGGAQWKINNDMMLQGGYSRADNLLDMSWVDFDFVHRFDKDRYVRLDVQYLYQTANGTNNLGDFSMNNKAAYLEGRWMPWWIPYAAFGWNSHGDELRSPFSLGPSYLVQRIGENAKAGEKTVILGSTFDFSTLGARGLAFDVSYGERSDRHVKGNQDQPLADWNELATDLIYTLGQEFGWAKGIRMRARWARVWEKGPQFSGGAINNINQQQNDVRFDLQWRVVFN